MRLKIEIIIYLWYYGLEYEIILGVFSKFIQEAILIMDNKANPNGVNNENEVVKKAAPPPMKRVKKGEQSAAVAKAAKTIEENKTNM